MSDKINVIRQRLELAGYLPEQFGNRNSAADRWHEDVTTLLAEIDRLRAALTEITDLDLEGDASLADAIGIADEALNPPPA